MADVFISYKSEDRDRVADVAQGLESEGFEVWWDAALQGGETYDEVIERALHDAKVVVVLWSSRSVGSRWVRSEATVADRQDKLVPATIEPCNRPIAFELTHTATLDHWAGDLDDPDWRRFVEDVRARRDGRRVTRAPVPPSPPPPRAANTPPPRSGIGLWGGLGVGMFAVVGLMVAFVSVLWTMAQSVQNRSPIPMAGPGLQDLQRNVDGLIRQGARANQPDTGAPPDFDDRYVGRWSDTDPVACTDALVTTLDDGDLVVTDPDGRKVRHEILSAIGERPVTIVRKGYKTVGTFKWWVTDEGQTLHQLPMDEVMSLVVGSGELRWGRCR